MTKSRFEILVQLLQEYSTEVSGGEVQNDVENDPKHYASVAESLNDEFIWHETPEGEDFWFCIYDILKYRSIKHNLCSECGQHLPE